MRNNLISASIAGLVAVVAGFAVLPRGEERAVAMLRDGNLPGALALFEDIREAKENNPQRVMQKAIAEDEAGHVETALETLKRYVEQWPKDEDGLIKLASVAKSTMNTAVQTDALERLVKMGAKGSFHRELLGIYRTTNNTEKEKQLLISLGNNPDVLAEDLERLGTLLEVEGNYERALSAFRLADQRAPADMQDARFKLLLLLLKEHAFNEAVTRATTWSKLWKEPALTAEIATHFAAGAPAEYTVAFARSVSGDERDLDLVAAAELGRQGYRDIAFEILMQAARKLTPGDMRLIKKFVETAMRGEDPRAPLTLLSSLLSAANREADAALLAEEIADNFGMEVLYPLNHSLGLEVLLKRPLFGVQMALAGQNADLARRILLLGTPQGVSNRDMHQWAELMFTMLGAETALHRIIEIEKSEKIPAQTLAALEAESMKYGIPLKSVVGIK
ncbi:MAG: hypothetical protein ACK5KM_08300 [Hyphomicrobiaceae bacterium]